VNISQQNPNAALLLAAVEKLLPLLGRITFVGGCATGLLITDPAAAPVRPTRDVDAIVEIASYPDFTQLEDRLRQLGFWQPHVKGDPLCRWANGEVILDIMPTDSRILGFGNRWYGPAFEHAAKVELSGHICRLITAPFFLATKLEAFRGRGKNDYRMSHDLEDIVTVVDGRREIVDEVTRANPGVRKYLGEEFFRLLANRDFREALPGHLLPDAASQQHINIVRDRLERLAAQP